jgi:hypothetical protein
MQSRVLLRVDTLRPFGEEEDGLAFDCMRCFLIFSGCIGCARWCTKGVGIGMIAFLEGILHSMALVWYRISEAVDWFRVA